MSIRIFRFIIIQRRSESIEKKYAVKEKPCFIWLVIFRVN